MNRCDFFISFERLGPNLPTAYICFGFSYYGRRCDFVLQQRLQYWFSGKGTKAEASTEPRGNRWLRKLIYHPQDLRQWNKKSRMNHKTLVLPFVWLIYVIVFSVAGQNINGKLDDGSVGLCFLSDWKKTSIFIRVTETVWNMNNWFLLYHSHG